MPKTGGDAPRGRASRIKFAKTPSACLLIPLRRLLQDDIVDEEPGRTLGVEPNCVVANLDLVVALQLLEREAKAGFSLNAK